MENEILQHLKEEIKKEKLPDLDSLCREDLVKYINTRFSIKDRLTQLINYIYIAVQQSYFDRNQQDSGYVDFTILEGNIRQNPDTGEYIFTPNDVVKKLLSSVDRREPTKLKTFLSTKFYKIIEYLYNCEIKGYIETLDKTSKIPKEVLELAMENEKEALDKIYKKKYKELKSAYLYKLNEKQKELDEKQKDYEDLEEIISDLQKELDKYRPQ